MDHYKESSCYLIINKLYKWVPHISNEDNIMLALIWTVSLKLVNLMKQKKRLNRRKGLMIYQEGERNIARHFYNTFGENSVNVGVTARLRLVKETVIKTNT